MKEELSLLAYKFEATAISTDVVLPQVKVNSVASKDSPEFSDPRYFPFYYRLGCEVNSEISVQIGTKLGLIGAAFLRGCKCTQEWHIYEKNNPNHRIVESNLKLYGSSKIFFKEIEEPYTSDSMKFANIAFLSEIFDTKTTDFYLDFLWNSLKPDGLLVVDYIENKCTSESFYKFCAIKNREPILFKTRYGVGVLTR